MQRWISSPSDQQRNPVNAIRGGACLTDSSATEVRLRLGPLGEIAEIAVRRLERSIAFCVNPATFFNAERVWKPTGDIGYNFRCGLTLGRVKIPCPSSDDRFAAGWRADLRLNRTGFKVRTRHARAANRRRPFGLRPAFERTSVRTTRGHRLYFMAVPHVRT